MQRKVTIGLIVVLLAGAGGLVWTMRDKEQTAAQSVENTVKQGQTAEAVADAIAKSRSDTRFKSGVENMPKSLLDTEVDGALEVDAAGNLVISIGVRNTFDYFLSALGEEDLTTIVSRIRAYIRTKLAAHPQAAAQAEKILDGYLAYREALGRIPQAGGSANIDIVAIRRQKEQVASLRTQYLERPVIDAFFGDEDAYDSYTMSRFEIMGDKTLSATDKAKKIAALMDGLPPALKESMETLNKYQNLTTLTDDWKTRNGKPEELRAIREQLVGAEATDRLEALDKERAAWDGRMNDFFAQRDAIMKNQSLSEQDRQKQVNDLKLKNFNEQERVRVETLTTIHDQGIKM